MRVALEDARVVVGRGVAVAGDRDRNAAARTRHRWRGDPQARDNSGQQVSFPDGCDGSTGQERAVSPGAWRRGGLYGPITPVKTAQIAPEALSWHPSVVRENGCIVSPSEASENDLTGWVRGGTRPVASPVSAATFDCELERPTDERLMSAATQPDQIPVDVLRD